MNKNISDAKILNKEKKRKTNSYRIDQLVQNSVKENQANLAFLAEASKVLASSLHYKDILKHIAKLSIPYLADFCVFDILSKDNSIQRLTWEHADKKLKKYLSIVNTFTPEAEYTSNPVAYSLRFGKSVFVPYVDDAWLQKASTTKKHLEFQRTVGYTSVMSVPLKARGKINGTLTFIFTKYSNRHYRKTDLHVAEELATRAALAIENSRLFEEVQEELKERKIAELAFRESEARKTAFFETALDAIITMNAKGQVIEFNPAAERMFGYTRVEAIGQELASLIIPQRLKNSHRAGLTHYLKTGEEKILNKRIEITAQRKGGELFPVELTVSKVPSTAGILFTGTIQDISQRKDYENRLSRSEERLRLALDAGKIGVWDWDIQSNRIIWSDRVYEFYGATRETFPVTYENFSRHIFPEDKERTDDAIRKAVNGTADYDIAYRILTLKGETRWIASRAIVTRDDNGKPLRMLGATSDITEQKKLDQDKNDFVSIATHELKTPVTSIKAYAQVLQKKFTRIGDSASAGQLDKMNTQLDKLTSLIADLLDATKIESGKLHMHEEKFNFDKLVSEIVEELQRTTEKHTITITGSTNKKIIADKERIGQVLTNLISNAIKYSPHTDKIVVEVIARARQVQVCIKDFGVGIPKEKQNQVFERFYRVSGPKEITFPGLGLGLYISSEIISRHEGRIWVDSQEGKGSTFCFSLPVNRIL